jgi:hypothetical protein
VDGNDEVRELGGKESDGIWGVDEGEESEGKDEGVAKVYPAPKRTRRTDGCMGVQLGK